MKDLFAWWFFPKRLSSIIKIIIGLIIFISFFDALIRNSVDLIDAIVNPPLYLGASYLLLPIISSLFTKAIFWGGLFYLPYYIFGKRSEGIKKYLMPILLVALIIGSGFVVGIYTKPGYVEIARTQLDLLESRLGEKTATGDYYTLDDLGSEIDTLTKGVPDLFINEDEGFSKLVLFYKDCEKEWAELYEIPEADKYAKLRGLNTRTEWRKAHILEEAMLLFWGKYEKSVFVKGSNEGEQVVSILKMWFDQYGIDKYKHPHWANWTLPPK